MAAATIDDLIKQIEKGRAITLGLEQKTAVELERLEWLEKQFTLFTEIGGLLTVAGEKAREARQRMP